MLSWATISPQAAGWGAASGGPGSGCEHLCTRVFLWVSLGQVPSRGAVREALAAWTPWCSSSRSQSGRRGPSGPHHVCSKRLAGPELWAGLEVGWGLEARGGGALDGVCPARGVPLSAHLLWLLCHPVGTLLTCLCPGEPRGLGGCQDTFFPEVRGRNGVVSAATLQLRPLDLSRHLGLSLCF